MRDFSEFRQHWRPLAACLIGMGTAYSLNPYILSPLAPYFLKEFGWSKAQWALMGLPQFLVVLCVPLAGRLADIYGVRRIAAIGAITYPISLLLIAMMNGDPRVYLAIAVGQVVLCSTTTSTIFTRLAAENFVTWRGLALALCGSGPALVALAGVPLITSFAETYGWRASYMLLAGFCAVCSAITFLLMPATKPQQTLQDDAAEGPTKAQGVYGQIMRQPVFWMMLIGAFLVNVPHALVTSQLGLLIEDQGANASTVALLMSVFAAGVTIGRLASGLALDYFPTHLVAAIGLGLPLPGLLLLASSWDSTPVLALAILLMGLSFGSEGDVLGYLVVRYFGIGVFSTVLGLITAAIAAAMASGTLVLSIMLKATNSFNPYLILAAGSVALGSLLFLMLGAIRPPQAAPAH